MAATAKKKKPAVEDTAPERVEIEARIAELRRMEGKPVELVRQAQAVVQERQAEIAGLEAQLAELDAQTGASIKAERDATQAEYDRRISAERQRLLHHHEVRLNAIRRLENAVREMKEVIPFLLGTNEALRRNVFALSGEDRHMPTALNENELVSRLSARFSSVMTNLTPRYRSKFGGVSWSSAMRGYNADQKWADEEEKLVAPHIQKLIEKDEI
jgi:chromosome segregation ATPase